MGYCSKSAALELGPPTRWLLQDQNISLSKKKKNQYHSDDKEKNQEGKKEGREEGKSLALLFFNQKH